MFFDPIALVATSIYTISSWLLTISCGRGTSVSAVWSSTQCWWLCTLYFFIRSFVKFATVFSFSLLLLVFEFGYAVCYIGSFLTVSIFFFAFSISGFRFDYAVCFNGCFSTTFNHFQTNFLICLWSDFILFFTSF